MSFSTNGQVALTDSSAATVTYSEVQNSGSKCIYSDRTRDIGVGRSLEISHQQVGSGETARLRSMIKLSNNIENSALAGDVVEHRIHMVFDTPLRVCQKTDVEDVLAQFVDLLGTSGIVDQIMNQEV